MRGVPPGWGQRNRTSRSLGGYQRMFWCWLARSAALIFGTNATSAPPGTLKHHLNAAMNAAIVLKPKHKERPEGRYVFVVM